MAAGFSYRKEKLKTLYRNLLNNSYEYICVKILIKIVFFMNQKYL